MYGRCLTACPMGIVARGHGWRGVRNKEGYMNIIKSIVMAVVETVGFIIAVIGITIFGIAFS